MITYLEWLGVGTLTVVIVLALFIIFYVMFKFLKDEYAKDSSSRK